MTITTTLLSLIADGKPRSLDQMSEESGLPRRQVELFIQSMQDGRYVRLAPRQFELTATGLARAARVVAREKLAAQERTELLARIAARAAAKLKPVGRPPGSPEQQRAAKENNALRRRQKHQADRLARLAAKAAERAAAEAKKEFELDAELEFSHSIVAAPAVSDSIVSTAVQSRPAIQAVWGAMHA
jgi:hypothetical protein